MHNIFSLFWFPLISFPFQGAHMFFWKEKQNFYIIPAGITCSKSKIEVLEQSMKYVQSHKERSQNNIIWHRSGALIVTFKHVWLLVQLFWLLALSIQCWQKLLKFSLLLSNKITRTVKIINYILIKSSINFH